MHVYLAAIFYYIIGNIPPQHRSSLAAIQLVTVVKYVHLMQYGIDTILEPFITAVSQLEKVNAVEASLHVWTLSNCAHL